MEQDLYTIDFRLRLTRPATQFNGIWNKLKERDKLYLVPKLKRINRCAISWIFLIISCNISTEIYLYITVVKEIRY